MSARTEPRRVPNVAGERGADAALHDRPFVVLTAVALPALAATGGRLHAAALRSRASPPGQGHRRAACSGRVAWDDGRVTARSVALFVAAIAAVIRYAR